MTHAHIFWQFSDLDFVWQSCQSGQQNSVKLWVSFCAYKLEEEVYCLKVIPIHPSLKWLIALPFLQDRRSMHSGLTGLKIMQIYQFTVLHFTSERLSPRFLPQNQIKFLSVKKFYFWLTAFCLASDNFKQEIEKYPSVVCFLAMFLVLQKVTINPYKNSKFPFMMY